MASKTSGHRGVVALASTYTRCMLIPVLPPCKEERAIAFECVEMVSIRSQANVAVGAQREQSRILKAEEISNAWFKISGLDGKLGIGAEGDDCFKQWRASDKCLHSSVEVGEGGGVCGWSGQKHESVAGALGKAVKSRERFV